VPYGVGADSSLDFAQFRGMALMVSLPIIALGALSGRLTLGVVLGTVVLWACVVAVIIAFMMGLIHVWQE